MSAAPSNLCWEDWSNSFLDKNSPQVNGDNTCSIPQFWKGKALSWSRYCPGSKSSTVSPGNKLVFNKTDHDIYSVGGERIQNTATCKIKIIQVNELIIIIAFHAECIKLYMYAIGLTITTDSLYVLA